MQYRKIIIEGTISENEGNPETPVINIVTQRLGDEVLAVHELNMLVLALTQHIISLSEGTNTDITQLTNVVCQHIQKLTDNYSKISSKGMSVFHVGPEKKG